MGMSANRSGSSPRWPDACKRPQGFIETAPRPRVAAGAKDSADPGKVRRAGPEGPPCTLVAAGTHVLTVHAAGIDRRTGALRYNAP